ALAYSFLPAASRQWQWWKPASHSFAQSPQLFAVFFACSSCSPLPFSSSCRSFAYAPAPAASPAAAAPRTPSTLRRSMVIVLSLKNMVSATHTLRAVFLFSVLRLTLGSCLWHPGCRVQTPASLRHSSAQRR